MSALKLKIFLTKKAQEILFGYFEGVDWQIGLTTEDADGIEREMTEKEQDQIRDKVCNWIDDYRKKYNGKFSVIEVDEELAYYLSADADNQHDLIESEVLNPSNDAEDMFEAYIAKNGKEYDRVKESKKELYQEYKLASKQLKVLSNVDRHWRL